MTIDQNMILFGGLALVFLLVLRFGSLLKKQKVEIKQLRKKVEAQGQDWQDSLQQQEIKSEQLHTKLLMENHQQLNEEKNELAEHFNQVLTNFEEQNSSLADEVVKLGQAVEETANQREEWQNSIENKQDQLKQEYQQFQDFIEEQLQKVVQHSSPLPDQLDMLTSKLAQIKQLRSELNEIGQPLSVSSWRDHYRGTNLHEENEKLG